MKYATYTQAKNQKSHTQPFSNNMVKGECTPTLYWFNSEDNGVKM